MAKFMVEKTFRDKYTKEKYQQNSIIEMTVKRAKEVEKNLAAFGGPFLKRIDEKEGDK